MLLLTVKGEDEVTNNFQHYLHHALTIEGADVEIVESFVNFGNIACGTSTAHVLHVKNNSQTVNTVYQVSNIIIIH